MGEGEEAGVNEGVSAGVCATATIAIPVNPINSSKVFLIYFINL
jgi:hypothetical protein